MCTCTWHVHVLLPPGARGICMCYSLQVGTAEMLPVCGEFTWLDVFNLVQLVYTVIALIETCIVLFLFFNKEPHVLPLFRSVLKGRCGGATAHYSGRLGRRASGLGGATHSGDGGAPPPRSPLWQHAVLFSACANVTRCSAFPPRAFTFPTQVARKGLQAVASKALRQGTRRVRRHKARVIE